MHELCCVSHLHAGLSREFVPLCSSIWIILWNAMSAHSMVTLTTAFMQIVYTRAPKLGRHNQYGFLASRYQRTVSWSSCSKPLEACRETPCSECWSCLCSSDPQSHNINCYGNSWCNFQGVLLALNNCAYLFWLKGKKVIYVCSCFQQITPGRK